MSAVVGVSGVKMDRLRIFQKKNQPPNKKPTNFNFKYKSEFRKITCEICWLTNKIFLILTDNQTKKKIWVRVLGITYESLQILC